jgi:membrane protein implicated in regulation of membrane protease activity
MVDLLAPGTLPLLLVVAGIVISILEAMAPGAHFIVLGVALLVAGLVGLVFPPAGAPLVLAAMVLVVGAGALWGYRNLDLYGGTDAGRTTDSQDLTGREGVVTERVTQTEGRVRLYEGGFDPTFTARALDDPIPKDEDIIVVDPGGGSVLTVASIEDLDADSIDRELARERARRTQSDAAGGSTQAEGDREADTEEPDPATGSEVPTSTARDQDESS